MPLLAPVIKIRSGFVVVMQLVNVELAIQITHNVKTLIEGIKGDSFRFSDAL
jgi:hypothetical protein